MRGGDEGWWRYLLQECRVASQLVEEVSLSLLKRDLRHAERERLSEILRIEGAVLGKLCGRARSVPEVSVVAELIHDLRIQSRWRRKTPILKTNVLGVYPLPWGFYDSTHIFSDILSFLLRAAVEHTERGVVTVVVQFEPSAELLSASIADTRGRKRADEALRRFEGRPGERSRDFVMHDFVERLWARGGDIRLSVEPRGACVYELQLPIKPIQPMLRGDEDIGYLAREIERAPRTRFEGRALIVDRSPLTARSLSHVLRSHGLESYSMPQGRALREMESGMKFDSLWIDEEDPILQELAVERSFQSRWFKKGTVILRAHKVSRERFWPSDLPMLVLRKPISRDEVRVTLERMYQQPKLNAERSMQEERLISDYARELPRVLSELDGALRLEDRATAARITHTLKAATLFGFPEVGRCARALEVALAQGELSEIAAARNRLFETLARIPG